MQASDAALILACRNGDEQAWDSLVSRYQRLVYGVPRRAGLDERAAAEVFQRVFAQLLASLDTLDVDADLDAWLSSTTLREIVRFVADSSEPRRPTRSRDLCRAEPRRHARALTRR